MSKVESAANMVFSLLVVEGVTTEESSTRLAVELAFHPPGATPVKIVPVPTGMKVDVGGVLAAVFKESVTVRCWVS
jgi:hypothetical protein